jgi:hypothetical protein
MTVYLKIAFQQVLLMFHLKSYYFQFLSGVDVMAVSLYSCFKVRIEGFVSCRGPLALPRKHRADVGLDLFLIKFYFILFVM